MAVHIPADRNSCEDSAFVACIPTVRANEMDCYSGPMADRLRKLSYPAESHLTAEAALARITPQKGNSATTAAAAAPASSSSTIAPAAGTAGNAQAAKPKSKQLSPQRKRAVNKKRAAFGLPAVVAFLQRQPVKTASIAMATALSAWALASYVSHRARQRSQAASKLGAVEAEETNSEPEQVEHAVEHATDSEDAVLISGAECDGLAGVEEVQGNENVAVSTMSVEESNVVAVEEKDEAVATDASSRKSPENSKNNNNPVSDTPRRHILSLIGKASSYEEAELAERLFQAKVEALRLLRDEIAAAVEQLATMLPQGALRPAVVRLRQIYKAVAANWNVPTDHQVCPSPAPAVDGTTSLQLAPIPFTMAEEPDEEGEEDKGKEQADASRVHQPRHKTSASPGTVATVNAVTERLLEEFEIAASQVAKMEAQISQLQTEVQTRQAALRKLEETLAEEQAKREQAEQLCTEQHAVLRELMQSASSGGSGSSGDSALYGLRCPPTTPVEAFCSTAETAGSNATSSVGEKELQSLCKELVDFAQRRAQYLQRTHSQTASPQASHVGPELTPLSLRGNANSRQQFHSAQSNNNNQDHNAHANNNSGNNNSNSGATLEGPALCMSLDSSLAAPEVTRSTDTFVRGDVGANNNSNNNNNTNPSHSNNNKNKVQDLCRMFQDMSSGSGGASTYWRRKANAAGVMHVQPDSAVRRTWGDSISLHLRTAHAHAHDNHENNKHNDNVRLSAAERPALQEANNTHGIGHNRHVESGSNSKGYRHHQYDHQQQQHHSSNVSESNRDAKAAALVEPSPVSKRSRRAKKIYTDLTKENWARTSM